MTRLNSIFIAIIVMISVSSESSLLNNLPSVSAKPEKQGNVLNVLKDNDGNTYTSKRIAGRRWMTRNLFLKASGSYCYDEIDTNCSRYGRLYTWYAAKKACNSLGAGWRLPTSDEWREMAQQYGGVGDDVGTTGRSAYRALLRGGSAKFDALLGGNRDPDGKYRRRDAHGFYWSATEGDTDGAWFYNFAKGSQALYRHGDGNKSRACSVRCVKP